MERTEEQWQADLFPELPKRFPELYRSVLTLSQLGFKNSAEARTHGFVAIRRAYRQHPGLWVHDSNLEDFEAAAEEIARERAAAARADAERKATLRATASRLLDRFGGLANDVREAILLWAEHARFEQISEAAVVERLLPRLLPRAIAAAPGLEPRGASVTVTGTLALDVFGREITRRLPQLGTVPLTPELQDVLFTGDHEAFRQAVETQAAPIRTAAISLARAELEGAIAEVGTIIDNALELAGLEGDAAEEARATLVDYTVERLVAPDPSTAEKLPVLVRRKASDVVFQRRREILARARGEHVARWRLAGDRKMPHLAYDLPVEITAVGKTYRATVERKAGLTKPLREVLLTRPLDEFVTAANEFVRERVTTDERSNTKQLQQLERRIEEAAENPALDVAALHQALEREFSVTPFGVDAAVVHLEVAIARLAKKARETHGLHVLLTEANFAHYSDFFRTARRLKRKLTLLVGPTNSGKTFHALNELAKGESGAYLAPLRLLALEGQEELENRGCRTSFLTGEERDIRPGARFVSSTIEMLNLDREVDVAVVDEVQLLGDIDRGWAWSAAVIGAPATHVVLTGSPDSVPLVENLAEYLGEELEVRRLERFTPLDVLEEPTRLEDIEPGTAVICFSRRDVLALKQQIETKLAVSVIYGNLSPQVRREEARRFRGGESKVLVATDAIAMGLNLPIRTVLFYTTWKWNGREEVRLSPAEVRQIGGRAGRFGKHDHGFVGALNRGDLAHIRSCFEGDLEPVDAMIQVRPSQQHVLTMSEVLGSQNLYELLELFHRRIRFDDPLLIASVPEEMLFLASLADSFTMPVVDKFVFTCAPVDTRDTFMMHRYESWMRAFTEGKRARIDALDPQYERESGTGDPEAFLQAELRVKMLTVYAWLGYRYPQAFPDLGECDRQRYVLNTYIERTLRKKGRVRRCQSCREPMPAFVQHAICDACFRNRRRRRRVG